MKTETPVGIQTWNIDPAHSEAAFSVRHLMISTVRGSFRNVSGKIVIDENQPENSSVEATIDTTSVDTRQEQRDEHLRSADFFDVANYPTITFKSTKVEPRGNGEYLVTGNLTIRDVTKPVILDVEETGRGGDPWGGERIGFTATAKIDRSEFGLTWNQAIETGGVVVGSDIKLTLDVQAVLAQ